MGLNLLEIILCVLFSTLIATVIFRRLRLSIILGYLVVGAVVGPNAIGLAHNSHYAQNLAEFGIVFLMFTVGLEFSLPKLFALRYSVFVIGGLQVLLTLSITMGAGMLLGMSTLTALTVGSIVAMSSTAIVVKQLSDQNELFSQHGLNAIGILLFQDLAVIPIIILIAELGDKTQHSLFAILLWALVKGLTAIVLIFALGRWLLQPVFRAISKTRAIELFTLTVLLVALTSAWLTNLFGLSYALGAFLAGLMLAETEFKHQIEVEIRPFRDILLALFFITIGMLADIPLWYQTWYWILLLLLAIIVGKTLVVALLTRLSGYSVSNSLRTGLVLAQGGEFSFAILTLALANGSMPNDYGQVIIAALLISIAIAPLLIRYNQKIATRLLPKKARLDDSQAEEKISAITHDLRQHIIICGYGRVGQHVARLLDKADFSYIALDLDSELVKSASLAGEHVIYGDPTHPAILKAAGLDHAKALVISFDDLRATLKILGTLKQLRPKLPVLVRCRDQFESQQLRSHGAIHIIAELFEASLTLSQRLLNILGVTPKKIDDIVQEMREKDYDLLKKVYTGMFEITMAEDAENPNTQIKPLLILPGAYAVNKRIMDLPWKSMHIELIAIRRGNTKINHPRRHMKINVDDILIVHGTIENIAAFEDKILAGP